jgi:hypothetical protein
MITWALVPLNPNEETPARRGRSPRAQSMGSVSNWTLPTVQSTCGDGWSTCRVFGSSSFCSAITILMTPLTPAAAWACPRLDLIEPNHSGRSRFWP